MATAEMEFIKTFNLKKTKKKKNNLISKRGYEFKSTIYNLPPLRIKIKKMSLSIKLNFNIIFNYYI